MDKLYVFGHKKPDTDTITSAIVAANFQRALGVPATPYKLGDISKETKFALSTFNVDEPETLDYIPEGSNVLLVDHNDPIQSVAGIENAKVKMVIDHHCINFKNTDPIYYMAEPVGCTATILYKLYNQRNVEINSQIAGLMLSAIISDTLLFKSPTCTDEDKSAAENLAQIAGVNIDQYGKALLKAGTDVSDLSPEQIINVDSKDFSDKNISFTISQINAVDYSIFDMQDKLELAIKADMATKNLDLYIFVVTDILNADSKVLVLGSKSDIVEKAFKIQLNNNTAILPGVVSRKKQILPEILNNLN